MRNVLTVLVAVGFMLGATPARAEDGHKHGGLVGVDSKEGVKAVEVGNKICPLSGEKLGGMGEIIKHEFNGKIYGLCCKACAKDFKKNPEKYSKIAEDEVKKEDGTATSGQEDMGHEHHKEGHHEDHAGHDHSENK